MTSERLLVDELLQFHDYIPRKKESFLELNNLYVDILREWVTVDGQRMAITGASLKILCALIRKKGIYMRHHELFQLLFPTRKYTFHDHSVHAQIMNLRKKLGRDIILNTRGEGYKINMEYEQRTETKDLQVA